MNREPADLKNEGQRYSLYAINPGTQPNSGRGRCEAGRATGSGHPWEDEGHVKGVCKKGAGKLSRPNGLTMVEAGGVEPQPVIENTQLIENATLTKRTKLGKCEFLYKSCTAFFWAGCPAPSEEIFGPPSSKHDLQI